MALVTTDTEIAYAQLSGGAGNFDATTTPSVNPHNGKTNAFLVSGTFDSATVKLQHKIGSTWVDVGQDTTLTASGGGLFTSPVSNIRVAVSGADSGGYFSVQVVIKPINL